MKKTLRMTFILFLFLSLTSCLSSHSSSLFTNDCSKNPKEYVVKEVFDGDTILIEAGKIKQEKVRLLGIDAFEYDQLPYGKIGKDYLTKLVLNKKVCIETDVEGTDVYGRTLGYVFINRHMGVSINEELLRNGLAILYDFPPNIKYIDKLKKAQIYGRQNMLGVWENQDYILETPSQWRKKHRSNLTLKMSHE